jgi:hypothetical protein
MTRSPLNGPSSTTHEAVRTSLRSESARNGRRRRRNSAARSRASTNCQETGTSLQRRPSCGASMTGVACAAGMVLSRRMSTVASAVMAVIRSSSRNVYRDIPGSLHVFRRPSYQSTESLRLSGRGAAEFSAKFSVHFQARVLGQLLWCWAVSLDDVVPDADLDYGTSPFDPSSHSSGFRGRSDAAADGVRAN